MSALLKRAQLLCALSLTSLLALSPLTAALMTPVSLHQLITQADYIARVQVQETSVRREGGRHISTHTLKLLALYDKAPSAPSPTSLTLETLGGSYQGLQQRVSGSPQLKQGEELIVFLRCAAHGVRAPALKSAQHQGARCRLVGMGQGLWRAQRTPHSDPQGQPWAPSLEGISFMKGGALIESALKPMSLSALLQAIREAQRQGPGQDLGQGQGAHQPSGAPLKGP